MDRFWRHVTKLFGIAHPSPPEAPVIHDLEGGLAGKSCDYFILDELVEIESAEREALRRAWGAGSPPRIKFFDRGYPIPAGRGDAPVSQALARAFDAPGDDPRFGAARFLGL